MPCKCCGAPLFNSNNKYDSKSGRPSFWAPLKESNIEERMDHDLGMVRKEIICAKCGYHLGYLFEDCPKPSGLRYCINSLSLDYHKDSSI
ncbi:MAG TPA: peptide-methionine (R)-S-oxide reductase [Candidatus Nitrosocosmicus sp.]|nr:peptide-methionine (R)-S-oxide reductase [Candidatus Nitrosocosmicus sp.]